MRSRGAVVAVATMLVPVVLLAGACSRSGVSRREVVDSYRRELVAEGVREDQARCLTDRFFGELSDAELRAFQERDELTDAERRRFTELAEECADPSGG